MCCGGGHWVVSAVLTAEKQKCRGCLLSAVLLFIQQFREGRGQNIDQVYKDSLRLVYPKIQSEELHTVTI